MMIWTVLAVMFLKELTFGNSSYIFNEDFAFDQTDSDSISTLHLEES